MASFSASSSSFFSPLSVRPSFLHEGSSSHPSAFPIPVVRPRPRVCARIPTPTPTPPPTTADPIPPPKPSWRPLAPVEKRFRLQVARSISPERLEELCTHRWSRWASGSCFFEWDWQVDEQLYIVKGSMCLTPENCIDSAFFTQGDLIVIPRWFKATVTIENDFEMRYRFLAYGD